MVTRLTRCVPLRLTPATLGADATTKPVNFTSIIPDGNGAGIRVAQTGEPPKVSVPLPPPPPPGEINHGPVTRQSAGISGGGSSGGGGDPPVGHPARAFGIVVQSFASKSRST